MRVSKGLTCLPPLANLLTRQSDQDAPDQDLEELFTEDEGTNALNDQGLSGWPIPSHNVTKWESGPFPEGCYNITSGQGNVAGSCDVREMDVYDIRYDDCAQPWTICRCPEAANEDINVLVTDLGQLPVRARDYVRYIVLSDHMMVDGQSSLEGISLYWDGDLVVYGNWSSVALIVHETAHNLDFWVSGRGEAMYSGMFSAFLSWF
jgi:hypothetical protein